MTSTEPLAAETQDSSAWRRYEPLFWGTVLVGVLFVVSLNNIKLFHALIEIVSVAVAWTVFLVMWNSRRFFNNAAFQLLAVGLLFVGIIDLLHALAYKGVDVFDTGSGNLPTQLWIAARYLQALSVVIASLLVTRKIGGASVLGILLIYAAVSAAIVLGVLFTGIFPDCYLEPDGLTRFKVVSEYVIATMFLAGGVMFFLQRKAMDRPILAILLVSIGLAIAGEMAFTLYTDVYGVTNQIGHYCKLLSFFLIYVAFIRVGLRQPYQLLFRDLHAKQDALHASREQLRIIIDQLPGVLWTVDTDMRFTASLGGGLAALGLKPNEVIGMTMPEYLGGEDNVIVRSHVQALAGETVSYTQEHNELTFQGHVEPLRDASGQIVGVLGVAFDVTQRRRAEDDRRELEAKMLRGQKLESLGILAGGIAHDFNNLLTVILGNTEMSLTEMPDESHLAKSLLEIKKASVRAAKLTDQMLAYAGKVRSVVQPIDVNDLVSEMAALMRTAISAKVTLLFEFSDDLPTVRGDAGQLQQVAMNLITNASDALGDGGGTVVIRTRQVQADAGMLTSPYLQTAAPPGSYVCLEVIDTGCGMDSEAKTRLFDPFYTTKFTGRGLGLAAVLGIIRTHGGVIQVDSAPEAGSTFRVFLPVSGDAVEPAGQADALEPSSGGTVLFADDDRHVRQTIRQMLEASGFSVLTVTDGRQAVEVFDRHRDRIDLVLLDAAMPEMDGAEAFGRIRALSADVPVFLCSGYAQEEVAAELMAQGLTGFIHKPFDLASLKLTLRSALGGG